MKNITPANRHKKEIIINIESLETRVAILENGKLDNFHRPGQPDSGWLILAGGDSGGDILVCHQGISFWGGVDPDTSRIIDAHHPDHGASLAGRVVMIP